jgi:glycosyltransferase involved in cell wall biosynthesis
MKITIVNTTDIRGGAAIAAFRLFKVIREKLPETRMLVNEKLTNTEGVSGLNNSFSQRIKIKWLFLLERMSFIIRSKNRELWFSFSTANFGRNIVNHPDIISADIVHLHWVNGGFLSFKSIRKLIKTGKPVVWTMQDMWAFTGGCHYSGSCTNFMKSCGDCFFLKSPSKKDISFQIHQKKLKLFSTGNISFIASSNWMAENARNSSLIGNRKIIVLPNPIDTTVFKPVEKIAIRAKLGLPRDKFLILSGAANLKDKRKGFSFLIEALSVMMKRNPEISENYGLVTFGKSSEVNDSVIPVYPQSYLKNDSEIAMLYQAANVYVIPTLEDNLPSTVMESLACGTPVVAFNTGGIPDMVDHKISGYLAELRNVQDLITGIDWVKNHAASAQLGQNCRKKVLENFSHEIIAEKYLNFYRSLLR